MHIKLNNGVVNKYPYSLAQLKQDNQQTSFPKETTNELLASFGIYHVQPTDKPLFNKFTHTVVEDTPVNVDGTWRQVWDVVELTFEEIASAQEQLKQEIIYATQRHLDDFARTRNYDGILSACTYATSTVPKFQAEGQYAVNARDNTWATLYTLMDDVHAGNWQMPTSFADVEPLLPTLTWPV